MIGRKVSMTDEFDELFDKIRSIKNCIMLDINRDYS